MRLTCGIEKDGTKFSMVDSWRNRESAHNKLDKLWRGATIYFDYSCPDLDASIARICAVHASPWHNADVRMNKCDQCVRFSDTVDMYEITPYSEVYGDHPHFLLATSRGWKKAPTRSDAFTGKSSIVMRERRKQARKKFSAKSAQKSAKGDHYSCKYSTQ